MYGTRLDEFWSKWKPYTKRSLIKNDTTSKKELSNNQTNAKNKLHMNKMSGIEF